MYPNGVIVILVTQGKHDSVDYAKVVIFEKDKADEANEYLKKNNTGRIKYWTKAEIMTRGDAVDLEQPE